MKKLTILQDGKRIVTERLSFEEHGNPIAKIINLSKATEEEFLSLQENPFQQNLNDEIVKRR